MPQQGSLCPTQTKMEQWTYVTLPCPFGGPQSTSKTCRDGITQLIESSTELHNSLASFEKALTTVQERMTNHVIASHNQKWQDASDHVSSMEPNYWTEKSVTSAMSPPNPTEPLSNECRYVTMHCPYTVKTNKTCRTGLTQIVGDSIDMAVSQVQAHMASHMTDVHDMSWDRACDPIHFQEVTVCVEAMPPMTQDWEADSSERRRRSRSPRGCKGGNGSTSSGSKGGSKGGKDGSGGKDGKGGKVHF
jgi:uncharacterized membrane protein YgcG